MPRLTVVLSISVMAAYVANVAPARSQPVSNDTLSVSSVTVPASTDTTFSVLLSIKTFREYAAFTIPLEFGNPNLVIDTSVTDWGGYGSGSPVKGITLDSLGRWSGWTIITSLVWNEVGGGGAYDRPPTILIGFITFNESGLPPSDGPLLRIHFKLQGAELGCSGADTLFIFPANHLTFVEVPEPIEYTPQFVPGTICIAESECADLQFRPSPNGWQFLNHAVYLWPESWWEQFDYSEPEYPVSWRFFCEPSDFPDWPLFVSAFGDDQCYYDPPPGTIVYRPTAVRRWFALKGAWGGSCFGFATTSFLYFDELRDVTTDFPGATAVFDVPSNDESRLLINEHQLYQFGRATREHRNANWETPPSHTLEACKQMFLAAEGDDRVLSLWNNGKGGGGHTVTPFRCEQDVTNSDLWYIYVYDNNHPGDENCRIEVNTDSDTWHYAHMPTWGGAKKFFLELPASTFANRPTMPKSIPPREEWTTGPFSTNAGATDHIELYIGPADTAIVMAGSAAIGHAGDSLFNTLSGAVPIIPTTGYEMLPIGYYLPDSTYDIDVRNTADSSFGLSIFGDTISFSYQRAADSSGQSEHLFYSPSQNALRVYTLASGETSRDVEVIVGGPDSEIVYSVLGIGTGPDDSIEYSVADQSALQIVNYGEATAYSLRIEIAKSDLDTVFYCDSVALADHCAHLISPLWRANNDSLILLIDSGLTGDFDDTLEVANQRDPWVLVRGDVNVDGLITAVDIIYLVNFVFKGGESPQPVVEAGDVNCSVSVTAADIIYLVNYVFKGGFAPC